MSSRPERSGEPGSQKSKNRQGVPTESRRSRLGGRDDGGRANGKSEIWSRLKAGMTLLGGRDDGGRANGRLETLVPDQARDDKGEVSSRPERPPPMSSRPERSGEPGSQKPHNR